jgi:molybdopterin converting factor small subunit
VTTTIRLPSPLAGHCDGTREHQVEGLTAETAVTDLVRRFPQLGPLVLEEGRLRAHLMVMRNGTRMETAAVPDEPLGDGDVLTLLFLAGGG